MFASMVIGYKIYFTNQEKKIPTTVINVAHDMVEKSANYDLCEFIRQ